MSDPTFMGLLIVVVIVVLVAHHLLRSGDAYEVAEENRPRELVDARVVMPRKGIAMHQPLALHGTPDVVYLTPDGFLVPREDKTGFPHPLAERIQLSVYACILRHNPPPELRGHPVADYGWVRYGIPGRTEIRWVKTRVFTDDELRGLVIRHQNLRNGAAPRMTSDPGLCRHACTHVKKKCSGVAKG